MARKIFPFCAPTIFVYEVNFEKKTHSFVVAFSCYFYEALIMLAYISIEEQKSVITSFYLPLEKIFRWLLHFQVWNKIGSVSVWNIQTQHQHIIQLTESLKIGNKYVIHDEKSSPKK